MKTKDQIISEFRLFLKGIEDRNVPTTEHRSGTIPAMLEKSEALGRFMEDLNSSGKVELNRLLGMNEGIENLKSDLFTCCHESLANWKSANGF